MSLSDEDRQRRVAAKRYNERVKLIATALNAVAIAVISVAVVLPSLTAPSLLLTVKSWILLLGAIGLHSTAHGIIGLMRSED